MFIDQETPYSLCISNHALKLLSFTQDYTVFRFNHSIFLGEQQHLSGNGDSEGYDYVEIGHWSENNVSAFPSKRGAHWKIPPRTLLWLRGWSLQ